MKKIFKYLILSFLLVFFASVSNVLADSCTDCWEKKEKKCEECGDLCGMDNEGVCVTKKNACPYGENLTIYFDDGGAVTISENFWPSYDNKFSWFKKEIVKDLETEAPGGALEWQLEDLEGLCPSKIYYCKVVSQRVDAPDLSAQTWKSLIEEMKKSFDLIQLFQYFSSMFIGSYVETRAVYLTASKSQMQTEFKIDGDKTESVGYELIEMFIDLKNGKLSIEEALTTFTPITLIDGISKRTQKCGYLEYSGKGDTYNLACSNTSTYLKEYIQNINNYKSCSKEAYCMSQELNKINRLEERIKKYCANILENYNYEQGSVEADCIDQCLGISDLIYTLKSKAGINTAKTGECGFSARLLVWVKNIVKWIKYIIPVILIILGILDFMKAITKDKEEEMKKAQSRFIKRLIAAALIFIIPFILGFILDKIGFGDYIDGCDVITELSDYNEKD